MMAAGNRMTSLILTPADQEAIDRLRALTGLTFSQVVRLSLRESVQARDSKTPIRRRRKTTA